MPLTTLLSEILPKSRRFAGLACVTWILSVGLNSHQALADTTDASQKETGEFLYQSLSTEEVPNLRIGWHINDAFAGHTLAIEQNKPSVIVFHSDYCGFCQNLLVKMKCPAINRFAGHMVFSVSIGELDVGAEQLIEALDVFRLPTLLVLAPVSDRIHVAGRIEGEVAASDVSRILLEATKSSEIDGFNASNLLSPEDAKLLSVARNIQQPGPDPVNCD